jgi:hypothetical protein
VSVVLIDAASEPASGSVVTSAVMTACGPVSGVSQHFFCSSVPSIMIGSEKNPLEHTRFPMPGVTPAQFLLHQALGEDVAEAATSELLGNHEIGDAHRRGLGEDVHRRDGVGFVDLAPLGRSSLAAKSWHSATIWRCSSVSGQAGMLVVGLEVAIVVSSTSWKTVDAQRS